MTTKKILKFVGAAALWAIPMAVLAQTSGDPLGTGVIDGTPLATNLGGSQSLQATIASIINVALSLLGIVAVVIILAGGFTWMTAGGNEEKVDKAKKMIISGIIGLAIILSAYAIAKFVIGSLLKATGAPGGL